MPLPVNTNSLVNELRATLTILNAQIEVFEKGTDSEGNATYPTKYSERSFVLADLLVAKAQCLAAIANLQSSTNASVKRR